MSNISFWISTLLVRFNPLRRYGLKSAISTLHPQSVLMCRFLKTELKISCKRTDIFCLWINVDFFMRSIIWIFYIFYTISVPQSTNHTSIFAVIILLKDAFQLQILRLEILYISRNILRIIKSRIMRPVGHAVRKILRLRRAYHIHFVLSTYYKKGLQNQTPLPDTQVYFVNDVGQLLYVNQERRIS